MAKKKSAVEGEVPDSSPYSAAGPSTINTPTTPTNNGGENKAPYVSFQLADGSMSTKRRLKQNVEFNSILPKIINKLAPDVTTQQVRLSHVRDQGREVDLIDEYDYASFQRRALDNPTKTQIVKVYIPSTSTQPISSSTAPPTPQPQTPSPAGLTNNNDNMFETPKAKSRKDKKGKRKAEDEAPPQSEAVDGYTQSQSAQIPSSPSTSTVSPSTPGVTNTEASAVTKSSRKKNQKASETLPQNTKSPVSSSSFDESSAQPHAKSLIGSNFITSPNHSILTPTPKKNKKRKRASDSSDVSEPPIPSATASSSTTVDDSGASESARTSKSPEKKRKKRSKKTDGSSTEQPSPAPSTPAVKIHLSSTTPSTIPYPYLQKYKPVTPSPLGRVPSPSIDGDADESNVEEDSPKVVAKEKKKKSKKSDKQVPNEAQIPVETSLDKASETQEKSGDQDKAEEVATPAKKKSKSKKAQAEAEIQHEAQKDTPADTDTLTPAQKKKKAKKAKKQAETEEVIIRPSPDVETAQKDHEVVQNADQIVEEEPVAVTETPVPIVEEEPMQIDETPAKPAATPSKKSTPKSAKSKAVQKSGKTTFIPLSEPYIFYARPNDPAPRILAKENSSSFEERPAQKVYGKSTKKTKQPVEDANSEDENDDASLEEEELPKSPEPPKKTAKSRARARVSIIEPEITASEEATPSAQTHAVAADTETIVEAPKKPRAKKKSIPATAEEDKQKETSGDAEKQSEKETQDQQAGAKENEIADGQAGNTVEPSLAAQGKDVNSAPPRRSPSPPLIPPPSAKSDPPHSVLSSPDSTKTRRHLTSDYHKQLAARGQCIICDGPPHLQKDCPDVAKGLDHLKSLLEEKKGLKKTELVKSSIDAIETWVNRLGKIATSVKGTNSPTITAKKSEPERLPLTPEPVNPVSMPDTIAENTTALKNNNTPLDSAEPSSAPQISSPASSASPEPASQPTQLSQPLQSPLRDPTVPPIYFKALATKAGSVSGLSVSDAVIETGSSASESDSENESGSDSGSGSDSDSDAKSTSSRGSQTSITKSRSRSRSGSANSFARSPSLRPAKGSNSLGSLSLNDFMSMPLSQDLKRRARESAAGMKDVEMNEEIQEPSDTESTPERQLPPSSFVARPRAGSESSVGEFADEKSDDDVDMEEDDVMPFSQPPNLEPNQEDQAETIEGETAPEESSNAVSESTTKDPNRRSFMDLADAASPSPIVAEFPGSIALQEAIDEDAAPENITNEEPSPRNEDGKTGHVISQGLMSPPSSSGEEPDLQSSEPMPATQLLNEEILDEEPTPKPLKRRVTCGNRKEENELAPPIDIIPSSSQPLPSSSRPLASSPPRRRLRSMSREPTVEPSSPRITTRRVSASQPEPSSNRYRSKSPSSNFPVRRSTRRTTPSSQVDELVSSPASVAPQPRRSSRRGTTPLRSSQNDQLGSSPPLHHNDVMRTPAVIPEEDEDEDEANLSEKEATQQTPEGLKTPLVPETQESEPRYNGNGGLRSKPSPLFMSQGSQIPQTQAYNLYPNLPSSDTGLSAGVESETQTPRGKPNGTIPESPLSTRKSNGLNRKSSLRFTSPIMEDDEQETLRREFDQGETINGQDKEQVEERVDQVKDSQPQEEESDIEENNKINSNGGINGHEAKKSNDGSSSSESSDSEDEAMKIPLPKLRSTRSTSSLYPALPSTLPRAARPPSSSQPSSTNPYPFPTLSSLSKDALRSRASFGHPSSQPNPSPSTTKSRKSLPARNQQMNGFSKSQPLPNNDGSSDESGSGSESDSSEEEKTPVGLKGRFAKGGRDKNRLRRASQANIGW